MSSLHVSPPSSTYIHEVLKSGLNCRQQQRNDDRRSKIFTVGNSDEYHTLVPDISVVDFDDIGE